MANNEIKTNAEIYREQRKERLAKAAKKNSNGKTDKIVRTIVKVLCIVLAVSVVLFGALKMLTEVFCVPQKVLSAAKYGDEKLTVAEYNYYYMGLYNQAVSISQQYDQQYSGFGSQYFDTTVSPSEQDYTGEDAPEGVKTWADYFRHSAHERGFLIKSIYNEAMSEEAAKAGFKLTDAQQEEMDTQIKDAISQLETKAKSSDFSLNNYIARVCGEGLTEKTYKELLKKDYIAQCYLTWYQENTADKITDKEVAAYYKEHRADIDIVDVRYFTVSYSSTDNGTDKVLSKKEAKAIANKFAAAAKSDKAFVEACKKYAPASLKDTYKDSSVSLANNMNKASLESLSAEIADWTMSAKRKTNEIKIFDVAEQEAYYIIFIKKPARKDTTTAGASVRHLLVEAQSTTQDAEGNQVSLDKKTIDKNFATAKDEASTLLKQWKNDGATEEKFIEYVRNHSDDTGSVETGGLYENITSESSYVPEFLEWSLAKHKKGDTGLVKTDYGYHIMYYVGADKTQKWENDVRTAIASNTYNDYFDGIYENISKESKKSDVIVDFFADRLEEVIDKNVANLASQQQLSYAQ